MLTVGEWAVLVETLLDATVDAGGPRDLLDCGVMAEMDTLTDAEGISGFYPLCDRCYKEINVACECPEDENEGDQVSSL